MQKSNSLSHRIRRFKSGYSQFLIMHILYTSKYRTYCGKNHDILLVVIEEYIRVHALNENDSKVGHFYLYLFK